MVMVPRIPVDGLMRRRAGRPKLMPVAAVAETGTKWEGPTREWCKVKDLLPMFGLSKSVVYGLIDMGRITTVVVEPRRPRISNRGNRLVEVESVRRYLRGLATAGTEIGRKILGQEAPEAMATGTEGTDTDGHGLSRPGE